VEIQTDVMIDRTVQYLIRFLAGDDISRVVVSSIGYTADPSLFHNYNLVIIPSGFFNSGTYGNPSSLPALPLQEIEGIPLLFGSPKTEVVGATLVVHADILASTYFLISRYEEMVRRQVRDEHGRFPGKESLPYRAGFIHRPIVDEYRILLRKWLKQTNLRLPEVKTDIRKVYLTHDVDAPFLYRSWKGFMRSLRDKRGLKASIQSKWGPVESDPYYTFPLIFKEEHRIQELLGKKNCKSVYFFKSGGKDKCDKPLYCLKNKDIRSLLEKVFSNRASVGLHSSYQAGRQPSRIDKEKEKLEKAIQKKVSYNRHHFLACREPEDLGLLEASRITDDFTMGYADVAGFRLGTSYPVRWINPVNRRLSPLILHPLQIMDCTLIESKYMGLDYEEAEAYCLDIIRQVKAVGGELSLLWHNTSFAENENSYLSGLYTVLLNELIQK